MERLVDQGIDNDSVLNAIEWVPRHIFVEQSIAHLAYEDRALPIGKRQTISQPYVVALMTAAAIDVENITKILEIGTGCGYQTAVLARLVENVYSMERIESLSLGARRRMRQLKLDNVRICVGDGFEGWEEHAPYDAIVVTAAAVHVSVALQNQVRVGGRIVVPLGRSSVQDLVCMERLESGWSTTSLGSVTFVPMLPGVDA